MGELEKAADVLRMLVRNMERGRFQRVGGMIGGLCFQADSIASVGLLDGTICIGWGVLCIFASPAARNRPATCQSAFVMLFADAFAFFSVG